MVALALATAAASRLARAAEIKLLVFLHVALKQRAFQSELSAALAGISVMAVGRLGDFDRALKEGQDAVLTLPVVLAAHGLALNVRGQRKGAQDEKYALVAPDKTPDPTRVVSVGALDLLGREGTDTFIHGMLGGKPKVERVTKVEDLLPLLQMQRVDAIVLPSRLLNELRSTSRLTLTGLDLAGAVGLPAVSGVGPGAIQIVSALGRLPNRLMDALGVDGWR
jgi:hypothetical protein